MFQAFVSRLSVQTRNINRDVMLLFTVRLYVRIYNNIYNYENKDLSVKYIDYVIASGALRWQYL